MKLCKVHRKVYTLCGNPGMFSSDTYPVDRTMFIYTYMTSTIQWKDLYMAHWNEYKNSCIVPIYFNGSWTGAFYTLIIHTEYTFMQCDFTVRWNWWWHIFVRALISLHSQCGVSYSLQLYILCKKWLKKTKIWLCKSSLFGIRQWGINALPSAFLISRGGF